MRTFQHKVTINDIGGILVFALGAFVCLWHRTNSVMVILGFILIAVTLRAVDRAIHSSYTLTDDGELQIKTGRIGRPKSIQITQIKTVDKRPFAFRLGYYALLELNDNTAISIQPDNIDSFLATIRKKISKKDNIE
jgi:hypothetical protein